MDETDISVLKFGKKKSNKENMDSHESSKDFDYSFEEPEADVEIPIRSIPTKDWKYDTNNKNLGVALLFNHKDIRGQDLRRGTGKDLHRTRSILENYGFDVRDYNDLKFEELSAVLKTVSNEDHSDNDCLVVVVMSHGIEGKVFAKDMPYPVERLWTPFLGINCKSLINKPKLFFIQACRGSQLEKPVTYQSDMITPMSRFFEERQTITYAIPTTADILIFNSTFEGHYSFRNVENGSWFIQCLCATLEEAAEENNTQGIELFQLLTKVNRRVAYEYQSLTREESTNEMKEMPNFLSTLTKIFYLRVKRK